MYIHPHMIIYDGGGCNIVEGKLKFNIVEFLLWEDNYLCPVLKIYELHVNMLWKDAINLY